MALSFKNFDFKELLLKYGQFMAVGVGLLVLVPVAIMGLGMVFSSGRASANAKVLMDKNQQATNALQTSRPPEDASKPPAEFFLDLSFARVDPVPYDTDGPWFVPTTLEDNRRRNPEILLAANLKPTLVLGGIPSYITRTNGKDLQVLALMDKAVAKGKLSPRQKKQVEQYQRLLKQHGLNIPQGAAGPGGLGGAMGGGFAGMGAGMAGGGMPGMAGGGRGGFGGGMGMGMGGAPPGMGGPGGGGKFGGGDGPGGAMGGMAARSGITTRRLEFIDLDKADTQKLAQDVRPVRMVVIDGSFPYRKQLEEFRSKLRKRSLTELMSLIDSGEAAFEFRGFEVQRKTYAPDGTVKEDWRDRTQAMIDDLNAIKALAVDFEANDPKLQEYGMLNDGLVAPRPMLARDAKYPPVDVKALDESIKAMDKLMKPDSKRPASDLARKLKGGKGVFNPFNPFNPFQFDEQENNAPPANKLPAQGGKEAEKNPSEDPDADLMIPDNVLVRLLDLVQPGYTYEYRIKVKMANPNYKRTKDLAYAALGKEPELKAGEWTMVSKIDVPVEAFWYAVDSRPVGDQVNLQMHRWVDYTVPTSDMVDSRGVAVADWSVLEREPTHRGEYIGRIANVEVPIWSVENETYELARNARKQTRIPIDFSAKDSRSRTAVLVDFDGGKGHTIRSGEKQIREDLPLELLVLNPDGKLILRNSVDDEENTERKERDTETKDWVAQVKNGAVNRQRLMQQGGGMGGNKMGGGAPGGGPDR